MGEVKAPVALINGRAGRVRRDSGLVARIRALLPARHVQVTAALDEVGPALTELAATGADTVFVVGGDGTTTGTLTELVRRWPGEARPALVLTRGGTINTIPKSLGAHGTPEQMLERYLAAPERAPASERALVSVRADQAEPRFGMIFANGAAARWLEAYYSGPSGVRPAAALVARTLASVPLGGRLAREIFQRFEARVELDGRASEGSYTVMGASSVRHVGLGFAPFLTAGHHPDRFHFVTTDASGARLGREIPVFALGFYPRRSCLRHASPRRVEIETAAPEPFTMDGDLFPRARQISLDAGPSLRFLSP